MELYNEIIKIYEKLILFFSKGSPDLFIFLFIIPVAIVVAFFVSNYTKRLIKNYLETHPYKYSLYVTKYIVPLIYPTLLIVFFVIISQIMTKFAVKSIEPVTLVIMKLSIAWFMIRLLTLLDGLKPFRTLITILVLGYTILDMAGLTDETVAMLDGPSFQLGEVRLSLFLLLKALFIIVVLFWIAKAFTRFGKIYVFRLKGIALSTKTLIIKLFEIIVYFTFFLVALNIAGVDLTAFAVLGGAVGVGIGFGLQKVVSNFISGIILLTDSSIKPGDVIVVGNTYGWVNSLGARYVSIITRDGKEHLIPNEQLITEKVENWSFSNNDVRIKVAVGVAYESDLDKVKDLILQAADECERILKDPKPMCFLREFGDSSVNLEIRFWINDPANGIGNIQDEILMKIWYKFRDNDVTIPFPQRDLHIKSGKID